MTGQDVPARQPNRYRIWLKKFLKVVVIVELTYLVVINSLLAIPLTQTVINKIRPEKFHISFDRAWSWYPARVHVRGASANGNSRTQIWQFDAAAVSGSIALLPLVIKRVWVSDVEAADVHFRMRPRLKPDKDFSLVEPFFPEIEGREVTPAVTTPRKKRRPWNISVEDIHVYGNHSYWIYQFKGSGAGDIRADLDYRSRGGPLALDVFEIDLELDRHFINGRNELFQHGRVAGSMGFAPFMPRENKGLPMLGFLLLDLDMQVDTDSLDFIRLFAPGLEGFRVDGSGLVQGRLRFDKGWVQPGTDLHVDARDLNVTVMEHHIMGSGEVSLVMGETTRNDLALDFAYQDLQVLQDQETQPMLVGQNLLLQMGGDGNLLPDPEKVNESRHVGVEIEGLGVPDLGLFQRYLPEKWPLSLYGGSGSLSGFARLTPTAVSGDLEMVSDEADMGIGPYRFETNLDAALKLDNPSILSGPTHVDGSYIRLSEARLLKEGQRSDKTWSAALTLEDGRFNVLGKDAKDDDSNIKDIFRILGQSDMKQLLGGSGGEFEFNAEVSSLAWIGVFLKDGYKSRFDGHALIGGKLNLAAGLPQPGTDLQIDSQELVVNMLDYASRGNGRISLQIDEGGSAPDWRMKVELTDADLRRRSDRKSFVKDVEMSLDARVEDVTLDQELNSPFALAYRISSARVTDMSIFNQYFPADSPISITGGEAQLRADILLEQDDADGWVRLRSNDIQMQTEQDEILGDLAAEITLVGGVPADMKFDISGSRVVLDDVRVVGEKATFDEEAWSAELFLTRGETVFVNPIKLDLEATLEVSDSRPIVAMFRNQQGWRPEFLARMMTLEDIDGTAELQMEGDRVVIPEAWVSSDNLQAGLKARLENGLSDGRIYIKYKKFDALLKLKDGKKNLDLIGVRKKYDEYEVRP